MPYGHIERFADRVIALLTNPDLWALMSKKATMSVRRFGWGTVGPQWNDVFQELSMRAVSRGRDPGRG